MNRRSFMKGLAGVVAAFGLTSKAEEPTEPKKTTVEKPSMNECVGSEVIFHHRKVWSCYGSKRILWTKPKEIQSYQVDGYIDLPTYDSFRFLSFYEGRLLWYGHHEIWELCHIGGIRVFVCQIVEQLLEGRTLGIMGAIKGDPWRLQAYCEEAISKGQMVAIQKVDDFGNIWVAPVKNIHKPGDRCLCGKSVWAKWKK